MTDNMVNTLNDSISHSCSLLLLYILSASVLLIRSRLIHDGDWRRALEAAEALSSFPLFLAQSLSLDRSLSISLFLCLKGFSERPEMKGHSQWEHDCTDSAGSPRYRPNCWLRVTPPYMHKRLNKVCVCARGCSLLVFYQQKSKPVGFLPMQL
ncbi:hypothetical protein ILYODFUR_001038 [Ilyodon furcidens]|uniref:Uncharacterized protein n=1 Tax=Ilyodon furcidens TaxID=33524 RepID=A0ABV0U1P1_9TELE